MRLNPTDNSESAHIGDNFEVKVNISLSQLKDNFVLFIRLPYSGGRAMITAMDVYISHIGGNFACNSCISVTTGYTTEVMSSQRTLIEVGLGFISNTGRPYHLSESELQGVVRRCGNFFYFIDHHSLNLHTPEYCQLQILRQ